MGSSLDLIVELVVSEDVDESGKMKVESWIAGGGTRPNGKRNAISLCLAYGL